MSLLNERIRHILRESGLSASFVAREVGVTPSAVLQWENGNTKTIRPEHLFKLADITGFDPRWIGTGQGTERGLLNANHRVKDLIETYARLDERGRQHVLSVAEREASYHQDAKT